MTKSNYTLKMASDGREMWFKNGKLVSPKSVPDEIRNVALAKEKGESAPKAEPKKELEGVELHGFKDDVVDHSETAEHRKQADKAEEVLKSRFPEFDFKVSYQPKRRYGNIWLKPVYTIQVFANEVWQCQIKMSDFSIPAVKQRLSILVDGPPEPQNSRTINKHFNTETTNQGTKEIQR